MTRKLVLSIILIELAFWSSSLSAQTPDDQQRIIEPIIVNGQQVPKDLLDWKYRSRRLREYLAEYRSDYDVATIEIRDGKLIVRSDAD